MGSTTRMVTVFGRRMTIKDAVSEVQWRREATVAQVAQIFGMPPQRLRAYAFRGVPMDAHEASKLENRIQQAFQPKFRRERAH